MANKMIEWKIFNGEQKKMELNRKEMIFQAEKKILV